MKHWRSQCWLVDGGTKTNINKTSTRLTKRSRLGDRGRFISLVTFLSTTFKAGALGTRGAHEQKSMQDTNNAVVDKVDHPR